MTIQPLKPLRIGIVAPLCESVPPRLYGGTERVVAYLTDALVGLGHKVTLFASGDSRTNARLVPCRDQAIRLDAAPLISAPAAHLSMLQEVARQADNFDVIHFHVDLYHLPMFTDIAARTITTLHGRLDLKDLDGLYRRWPEYPLVSISDSQRAPLPHANWLSTVHHGLPLHMWPFTPNPREGYLAFLGRISPEKRPDRAIALAERTGIPLKIAAKVDNADRDYFEREIEPLLASPLVEFIGEIDDARKPEFLGNARALLFPIDWPEPFGLVMIESMACGTPVIAWNCGSVPEIVTNGVTGRIVDCEDEAVEAIRSVDMLSRQGVRREFEQRFTSLVMARNYQRLYYLVSGGAARNGSLETIAG